MNDKVWTVERGVEEFEGFRKQDRLRQRVYREERLDGKTVACALGAFFGAYEIGDAHRRGCKTRIMPKWLVDLTPSAFDRQSRPDAIDWAARLYGAEGLVARANLLPEDERDVMWKEARASLRRVIACNPGNLSRDKVKIILEQQASNSHSGEALWIAWHHREESPELATTAANTVLDEIELALEKRGV